MSEPFDLDEAVLGRAAGDLRLLLGRGYPRQPSLALVGDRHALSASARQILHRGVLATRVAAARRAKLLAPKDLAGKAVAVDGHNQLIALEAALKGLPLVLGDDGVVRDIQGLGPRHRPDATTRRAGELLCAALKDAASVLILLDAPLSRSGDLAAYLRGLLAELGIPGEARAVAVPEGELLAHPGPVASSDGAVIQAVALPLDLAGALIQAMDPPARIIRLGGGDLHHQDDITEEPHA